ncbi:response regulator transcription factor [Collinsella sp. An2]|uniref:response regulator transcription factor n=1 Tax=Collinsella sp. An2 TaxID=1965585 RepID=UPI000B378604|nr:response regulator transcription factor [Collinsella sp. An2]OUP09168.1 DNA-binding response regulator [Collinsella sp. An2]
MAHILAVDDEQAILDTLARILKRDGHDVTAVTDPLTVTSLDLGRFDLMLCDVMMPGIDGFELVRQIRPRFDGPILFLTAKVAEDDAVTGYGMGADDYIRKPFGAAELRAKVQAHLRRERRAHTHALSFGNVRIDLGARQLLVNGTVVALTPSEYAICELLARRRGQVLSRSQILEAAFGWEREADEAAVSMHVSRARKKLATAGADPIATVWGMGYKWQL